MSVCAVCVIFVMLTSPPFCQDGLDILECMVPAEAASDTVGHKGRKASTVVIRIDKTQVRGKRCTREVDRVDDVDDDGNLLNDAADVCLNMRGTRCALPAGDEESTVTTFLHKVGPGPPHHTT